MEDIVTEYKQVTYNRFIFELNKKYTAFKEEADKTELAISRSMKVTTMSVRNCFKKNVQAVSDKVLTSLMKTIGMKGKIEWIDGVRNYYTEL